MPIKREMLGQSPEPEARDKVLDNNPDRIGIDTRLTGYLSSHFQGALVE